MAITYDHKQKPPVFFVLLGLIWMDNGRNRAQNWKEEQL